MVLALTASPAVAHPHPKHRHHCTQLDRVWSPARWRRGQPKPEAVKAFRDCPRWTKAKHRFYRHRGVMRWRVKYKPFVYPDGTRWAVPYPIAWCESGGDYFVGPYGAYGLIMEPEWMSPREQDLAAHRLYEAYGEDPWRPYESGCAYR